MHNEKGENKMQLSKIVKSARKEKNLSQSYVALQTGISLSTIQRMERGENVGVYCIQKVMDFLEIKIYVWIIPSKV